MNKLTQGMNYCKPLLGRPRADEKKVISMN